MLTYTATGLPTGLALDPKTGIISGAIDPSASVDGPFSVVVTADDGQGATISTPFTWVVANPAPTAQNDAATTDEDTAFTSTVAPNDSDPDGDTLTYSVVTDAANGTLALNPDGSYNYTPNQDFNGEDRFTYQVDDGEGGTSTATVVITIISVNDTPETTGISEQSGNDADSITPFDITGSFSDVDGDVLTYTATGLPTGLSLDPKTGVISGTIDPSASVGGDKGVYNVIVTATDPDGATVTDSFDFSVSNPAPTATDNVFVASENGATVIGNALDADTGAGTDSDPDGDRLRAVPQTNVSGSNGGLFAIDDMGVVTFDPNGAFDDLAVGETRDSVMAYTLTDGEGGTDIAQIRVTVTGTNDAPQVIKDGELSDQKGNDGDKIVPIDMTRSFFDPDSSDVLTYSATGLPAGLTLDPRTGILSGTIDPSASAGGDEGVYTIHITANDGKGGTVTDSFDWQVRNLAPIGAVDRVVLSEDSTGTGDVSANDYDPDGDKLSFAVNTNPTHGVVAMNPDGTFVYTPVGNYNGPDSFTYNVIDADGAVATQVVELIVVPVNDAPDVSALVEDQENQEGDDIRLDISGQFTDLDGDRLRFTATGLPEGLVLDGRTGIISGTLSAQAVSDGIVSVTVTAYDRFGGTAQLSFIWSIEPLHTPDAVNTVVDDDAGRSSIASTDLGRTTIGGASEQYEADGIIVSTVNGLHSLSGTSLRAGEGSPLNGNLVGQMVDRISDITGTSTDSWDVSGLTGFSIRMDAGTGAAAQDSAGASGQLVVETLVRKTTLYVEIKNDLKFEDNRSVQNYQVRMADGKPLPYWLKLADNGMLIGERPAHSETLKLQITAQMNDGSKIEKSVTIKTQNGEITSTPVQPARPVETKPAAAEPRP